MENQFKIAKTQQDKRLVFGWANVAVKADGTIVEDFQKDVIPPKELEEAAYDHVLRFRSIGERHNPMLRQKGQLVESVIFTKEKMKAMGIPEGIVPQGWWVGYYIEDDDTWRKIKKGQYEMFSIEGTGQRVTVNKKEKPILFDELYVELKEKRE